jgi:hypothetical protein
MVWTFSAIGRVGVRKIQMSPFASPRDEAIEVPAQGELLVKKCVSGGFIFLKGHGTSPGCWF